MAGTMDITVACGHLYAYDENLKSQKIPFVTETHDDDQQPRPITPIQSDETVIELLIKENQDVWDMLLKNKFCQTGYDSTGEEFNTIFQGYAKAHDSNCIDNANQDYRYLIEYVRFLTFLFLQDPSSHTEAGWKEILRTDEEAHGTIPKAVHGVGSYYECCIAMKINAEDLLKEKNSPPVLGYVAWEQLSAMTDDVFSNYVRMIPCIFGWNQIALELKKREPKDKESYFYKYWFKDSINPGPSERLIKFLEANKNKYGNEVNLAKWKLAFRQACLFEIAFFDAALRGDLPNFFEDEG